MPSTSSAELLAAMAASVQKVGTSVVVATIVIQVVDRKVITYVWLYYCALQIAILLVKRSNVITPASVDLVIDAISGVINLSSIDK
jgi:hypothetical protein